MLFKFMTQTITPRLYAKGIVHFWATPGGAVDPGESFEDAAARELFEETGWRAAVRPGSVLDREFKMQFQNEWVWAVEKYFLVDAPGETPSAAGYTALEQKTLAGHAWWSAADLRATVDTVFPEDLAAVMTRITDPNAL